MKKLTLLALSIFTLSVATLFGCSDKKSNDLRPNSELTAKVQINDNSENTDTDDEKPDCPDCEDNRPVPRRSCKRNHKRPHRRKIAPENTNKKSPD